MIRFLDQPYSAGDRLGDILNQALYDKKWTQLDACVAFVKQSGVLAIQKTLRVFSKSRTANFLVGVDLHGTSKEGLVLLSQSIAPNGSITIVHSAGASTFHPKIYCFRNDTEALVIIGSGNLTSGGLYTNFEGVVLCDLDLTTKMGTIQLRELDNVINSWANTNSGCAKLLDSKLLNDLVQSGLILPEAAIASSANSTAGTKLGSGGAPLFPAASIPSAPASSKSSATKNKPLNAGAQTSKSAPAIPTQPSATGTPANPTLWIETKKMTGGSRNILDLSMQGKRNGMPKLGSVAFFGLNPAATAKRLVIDITFKGTKYVGNPIFFAQANKNWRIQLKGISAAGDKLTSVPGGFVDKILTFKKLNGTHYEMTIDSGSRISHYEGMSLDWCKSGKGGTGRAYGTL